LEIIGHCDAPGCDGRVHYGRGTDRNMVGALGVCDRCESVYRLVGGEDRPVSGPALAACSGTGADPGDLDLRTGPTTIEARG
jgi:hypothetical protein